MMPFRETLRNGPSVGDSHRNFKGPIVGLCLPLRDAIFPKENVENIKDFWP